MFPKTHSPGLINLLEWLIELRETLYLCLPIYCKNIRKDTDGPGVVAHAYNPSTLGAKAGGSRGQEIETILVNEVKPRLY